MKKRICSPLLIGIMALTLCACTPASANIDSGTVEIELSDSGVKVNGVTAPADSSSPVYTGAEIIYYHDETDETYGEGEADEMHPAAEASAHTVVTITQPGTYRLSGTLSQGQIAVDLGEDAEEDPNAVVTLILDGANVTCTVAPALIFYNVYECGSTDEDAAGPDVDTSAAGANVIIAANSENSFTGSHVARIYKEGTTDKLHKYDGAFYSKMSMNLTGEDDESSVLHIVGDNEGLDSELHLTINSGVISIESQDDGINTNEDNVSVTTVNGGILTINAGLGAEGDGIDSNGYLTINGGTVWTMANASSPDGGIDADCAVTVNGGTLWAFGTRNESVDSASKQPYMEFFFTSPLPTGSLISIQDANGTELLSAETQKQCQSVTISAPDFSEDTTYSVYVDGVQQQYTGNRSGGMMGNPGGQRPDGVPPEGEPGELPGEPPEHPEGEQPDGGPADSKMPDGAHEMPEGDFERGQRPGRSDGMVNPEDMEPSTEFKITTSSHTFSGISNADSTADS